MAYYSVITEHELLSKFFQSIALQSSKSHFDFSAENHIHLDICGILI